MESEHSSTIKQTATRLGFTPTRQALNFLTKIMTCMHIARTCYSPPPAIFVLFCLAFSLSSGEINNIQSRCATLPLIQIFRPRWIIGNAI